MEFSTKGGGGGAPVFPQKKNKKTEKPSTADITHPPLVENSTIFFLLFLHPSQVAFVKLSSSWQVHYLPQAAASYS